MTWEEMEAMLNDIANSDLEQETRTNHLLALKKGGAELFTKLEEQETTLAESTTRIDELKADNMRLYLEIPTTRDKSPEEIEEEQAKEFEQTVTIADLQKGRV